MSIKIQTLTKLLESKKSAVLLLALVSVLQTACVANVSSQIKESNKDTSGLFEGSWIGDVQKSAGQQPMPGNWIANCRGTPWTFGMNVKNGEAQFNYRKKRHTTYVDGKGSFRFDIPMEAKAKAKAGSSKEIGLGNRTLVIYGNLKKAAGRVTFAVAEFGNNGCTAVVKFKPKGAGV